MRHRVFIAINLPENLREKLADFSRKWPQLPIRWVKVRNLHLTLAFLGYLSDEEIVKVCQTTKEVGLRHSPFLISLTKIDYGAKQKGVPRLIWTEGERSQELSLLKKDLDKVLSQSIGFAPENRDFLPHITLGRIRKWDWRRIEPDERPRVSEGISLDFEVSSIEVMESQLKRGGAEYMVLESVPLQKL